jgi:hypothetical protein
MFLLANSQKNVVLSYLKKEPLLAINSQIWKAIATITSVNTEINNAKKACH